MGSRSDAAAIDPPSSKRKNGPFAPACPAPPEPEMPFRVHVSDMNIGIPVPAFHPVYTGTDATADAGAEFPVERERADGLSGGGEKKGWWWKGRFFRYQGADRPVPVGAGWRYPRLNDGKPLIRAGGTVRAEEKGVWDWRIILSFGIGR
ncbi:hypothetical protein GCM10007897_18090 [Sphingobium jiangsuense]|nr:hypothetical protein GCM10007897_18090 [Sphingobium jiangsuense]